MSLQVLFHCISTKSSWSPGAHNAVSPYTTTLLGVTGPHEEDMLLGPYAEVQIRLLRAQTCQPPEVRIAALQNRTLKSLTDLDFSF